MTYSVIVAPALGFLLLFLAHILIVQIAKARTGDKFVIGLYLVFPAAAFLIGLASHFFGLCSVRTGVFAYMLFLSICAAWVASYPAVAAASPSLLILLALRGRPEGLTAAEIAQAISLQDNSLRRVEDAVADGLVRRRGDGLELTPLGRAVFQFFKIYRRAIGLEAPPL